MSGKDTSNSAKTKEKELDESADREEDTEFSSEEDGTETYEATFISEPLSDATGLY